MTDDELMKSVESLQYDVSKLTYDLISIEEDADNIRCQIQEKQREISAIMKSMIGEKK